MSHPFARKRFEGALHQAFEIRVPGLAPVAVRLVEVKLYRKIDGIEQFAALFTGPAKPQLGQGTHRFVNEQLGELDLFMVPVGPNRAGEAQYEVCFAIDDTEGKEDGGPAGT
jgi:hypothetical protein